MKGRLLPSPQPDLGLLGSVSAFGRLFRDGAEVKGWRRGERLGRERGGVPAAELGPTWRGKHLGGFAFVWLLLVMLFPGARNGQRHELGCGLYACFGGHFRQRLAARRWQARGLPRTGWGGSSGSARRGQDLAEERTAGLVYSQHGQIIGDGVEVTPQDDGDLGLGLRRGDLLQVQLHQ